MGGEWQTRGSAQHQEATAGRLCPTRRGLIARARNLLADQPVRRILRPIFLPWRISIKSKAALLIAVFVLCSSLASWPQSAQANEQVRNPASGRSCGSSGGTN
jgi:hypothetical protein